MSQRSENLATYFKAVLKLSSDLHHLIDCKHKQLDTCRLSFKLVGEQVAEINATTNNWKSMWVVCPFIQGGRCLAAMGSMGNITSRF